MLGTQPVCSCPQMPGSPQGLAAGCVSPRGVQPRSSCWYLDPMCACACTHMYYVYPSVTVLRHSVKPVTGPGWSGLPVTSCTDTDGSLAQTCGPSSSCPPAQRLPQTPWSLPYLSQTRGLSSTWFPKLKLLASYAGLVSVGDGAGCEEERPLLPSLALGPLCPGTQTETPLNK